MNNADKPIYPTLELDYTESIIQGRNVFFNQEFGLTKIEHYAGLAMQGLLALPDKGTYNSLDESIERICELSIKFADELLKQLENK